MPNPVLQRSGAILAVRVLLCALLATGLVAVPGCSGKDSGGESREAEAAPRAAPGPSPETDSAAVNEAIGRAIEYFQAFTGEPQVYIFLGKLRRRFELTAFDDMPARFDALMAERGPDPDLLALRRILDPANEPPEGMPANLSSQINYITVPALYCDVRDYPPNYGTYIKGAAEAGDYFLTHVGLALAYMDDNGCDPPAEAAGPFRGQVEEAMAGIMKTPGVTDLTMETAAFLNVLGRPDLVPEDFYQAVVKAQRKDGGWRLQEEWGMSQWHATIMGLWTLLEHQPPAGRKNPMLGKVS